MNDKPVLQSPGEKLAGLRQAAGRSLDDLAIATKIPLPMLQAIEQDEYHKISGDLYVKSFLRSYAEEVGLEAEEILTLYGNFTGAAAGPEINEGQAVWGEDEVKIKRLGPPWGHMAIIVAGVILVSVVGYFLLRGGNESGEQPAAGREGPESSGGSETPSMVKSDTNTTQVQHGSLLTGGPLANQEPPVAAEVESPVLAEVESPAVADPEPVLLPEAPAGLPDLMIIEGRNWPVVLRLICERYSGVSLKKDGDRQFRSVDWPDEDRPLHGQDVQAGWAYHVRSGLAIFWGAEDHFSLRLDDPTGIQATVNGQYRDLSSLGPGDELILNDPDVIRSNLPSSRP